MNGNDFKPGASTNGWNEWGRHVLAELERLNVAYEALDEKHRTLNENFVALRTEFKVRLSFLSGGVAFVVSIVTAIITNLLSH